MGFLSKLFKTKPDYNASEVLTGAVSSAHQRQQHWTTKNEYDVCLDDVDLNIVNSSLDRALDLMSNRIILRDDNTPTIHGPNTDTHYEMYIDKKVNTYNVNFNEDFCFNPEINSTFCERFSIDKAIDDSLVNLHLITAIESTIKEGCYSNVCVSINYDTNVSHCLDIRVNIQGLDNNPLSTKVIFVSYSKDYKLEADALPRVITRILKLYELAEQGKRFIDEGENTAALQLISNFQNK